MSYKVKWNEFGSILKKRQLQDNGPVQKFVGNEVARRCDKYVPLRLGPLKETHQVLRGGKEVKYVQPYARRQYYSPRKPGSDTGPLRGPYWFERMKVAEGQEIVDAAAKMAGGRSR